MATTFETTSIAHESPTLLERFADWAVRSSRPVQVSKMTRALRQLNDAQLAKVGLTRADIPAHAYRVVYQNG
jgi:uncharacterized protein YjiS (DUF1127 family)